MSKEQIQNIFDMMKAQIFVAPITDYKIGQTMFRTRFPSTTCNNCEQLRGWEDACINLLRAAYLDGGVACGDAVAAAVNELDFMAQTLDALRNGDVEPLVKLSDEQLYEIERDRPGSEQHDKWGWW